MGLTAEQIEAVEHELERVSRVVKASEAWGPEYKKDAETHAKLIRYEARMEREIRAFLRSLADQADKFVRWDYYRALVKADYTVEVTINDNAIAATDDTFIKVVFDTVALATAVGAVAGENIYNVPLGIQSTDDIIQRLTTEQLANLVGKSVDELGKVVDNPKAAYRLSDRMRDDIRSSIQTSINLGEDVQTATDRLKKTIRNPRRATTIARTETVNAYGRGLLEFGRQSGAVGKEWQDVGAEDICAVYAQLGVVKFGYLYDGVFLSGPAAHPNCRCSLRLIYPTEWKMLKL